MTEQEHRPQLKMVLSRPALTTQRSLQVPNGYHLRLCEPQDERSFVQLMAACGWPFDQERLAYCHSRLIPCGWFVVTPQDSREIVASAMTLHNYTGKSTYSGTLGWVSCLPGHRGNQLGTLVSEAVVARLIAADYQEIELYTEDFREPAIVCYFRMGFIPYLYDDLVKQVWKEVCANIGQAFTPDVWPTGSDAYPRF